MIFVRFGIKGASVSFSRMLSRMTRNVIYLVSKKIDEKEFDDVGKNCFNYLLRGSLIETIKSASRLIKIARNDGSPAVVLMPSPFDWILLFKRGGRKTVFVIVHDDKTHKGDRWVREYITQSYWRWCRPNIICLSNHVKKSLEMQGFEVCAVIHHPYFFNEVERKELTSNQKKFDFGIFGRLKNYQGIDFYCEVIKAVKDKGKNIIICGGDENVRISSAEGVVRVYGGLSDQEFFGYMASTNCVILPYTEATQSGVIPNALAIGCKLVTTEVGGIPEQNILNNFVYIESLTVNGIKKAITDALATEVKSNNYQNIEVLSPENFLNEIERVCGEK